MRFAFVIFKYFPFGGIQRDMMRVVHEAQSRGHFVKIFTLRWQAPIPDDIEVEVLPIVGLSRHTQYERLAVDVNKAVAADHFDLVFGFNKIPGLDVYYAGDSCYFEKALNQRSAWYRMLPRFQSFYAAEKAVFDAQSSTEILTISDLEVPRYRYHYRTSPERFHPLPPGIERDRIAPPNQAEIRAATRSELGLNDDQLMVLFIGSGFKKKGLDRALLAVAALPSELRNRVQVYVIGSDKADGFQRLAMRLGLASQVTFFAEGRDDVPRFLFSADALLHPAYDETAGMVIIEALLAGLPALVTKNCGYAKYLTQFDAGIVLPSPFSQLALNDALVQLLISPERQRWIENGHRAQENESLFQLVPCAVDKLQTFAQAKKRVLVFCLFRYFDFGGLQRDFMHIALGCQQDGYQIVVYCLAWVGEIPDGFIVEQIQVHGVVNHVRYQNFAETVAERIPWRRPVAVIGFNKMPGLDIYYAADTCYERKAQTMRSPIYRRSQRYKLLSKYEHAVFNSSAKTHILSITDAQKKDFIDYYQTASERFHLVPPGVGEERKRQPDWQHARQRVRDEFQVAEDEMLLLLLGGGFITKGLERALLALAALPDERRAKTRFLVIGQDNPAAFMRQALKLDIDAQVIFRSGRSDIPDVLQAADLMVHPAVMESGGLVLIEAIIAGLPVIASGVCGFSPYITVADAGCVLAEPFCQETLNQAVLAALKDDQQRLRWSQNGVAFGREQTDLYDMPRHAVKLINDLVAKK